MPYNVTAAQGDELADRLLFKFRNVNCPTVSAEGRPKSKRWLAVRSFIQTKPRDQVNTTDDSTETELKTGMKTN